MTTATIEALANVGGVATPDFALQVTFRKLIIPEFLLDVQNIVGDVYWRRKQWSQAVTASTRNYAIPTDLDAFEEIRFQDAALSLSDPLPYIGDDPLKVLAAEVATTAAAPGGYDIKETGVAGTPRALYLDAPPLESGTLKGRYLWSLEFSDETSEVDLNDYIPGPLQFPLVKLLKSAIYRDRYGIDDGRWQAEKDLYNQDVMKLIARKEAGQARRPVFCR